MLNTSTELPITGATGVTAEEIKRQRDAKIAEDQKATGAEFRKWLSEQLDFKVMGYSVVPADAIASIVNFLGEYITPFLAGARSLAGQAAGYAQDLMRPLLDWVVSFWDPSNAAITQGIRANLDDTKIMAALKVNIVSDKGLGAVEALMSDPSTLIRRTIATTNFTPEGIEQATKAFQAALLATTQGDLEKAYGKDDAVAKLATGYSTTVTAGLKQYLEEVAKIKAQAGFDKRDPKEIQADIATIALRFDALGDDAKTSAQALLKLTANRKAAGALLLRDIVDEKADHSPDLDKKLQALVDSGAIPHDKAAKLALALDTKGWKSFFEEASQYTVASVDVVEDAGKYKIKMSGPAHSKDFDGVAVATAGR